MKDADKIDVASFENILDELSSVLEGEEDDEDMEDDEDDVDIEDINSN